jgi:hypothetical protein
MSTDEDFVQHLRARADAAAPAVDVRTDRVVPRARRRRAWTRTAGTGAVALIAVTGVVVGQSWADAPWRTGGEQVLPAATASPTTGASPAPTAVPSPDPTGTTSGTAQGAAPYWYTLITGPDGGGERFESWESPDRPGLLLWDGDLANPAATGPTTVIGRFRIDGEWVDMLRDPSALPSDPVALEAVLRDSVEPDRRSGTDDEKVYGMAYDLLNDSPGWLPTDLLLATWQVAGSLPGSTVAPGQDALGRPGEVLTRPGAENGPDRLVIDPATGLLLEMNSGDAVRVIQQGPADTVPVEPTLEMAGCTAWESC